MKMFLKDGTKTFVLIFSGAMIVLAFIAFHLPDSSSQINYRSPANGAILTNGSASSNAPTPPINTETRGGATSQIAGANKRDALCASGFVEIPAEFKEDYLKHEEIRNDEFGEVKEHYQLKNQVGFHAFTFHSETKSFSAEGNLECKNAAPKPGEIKFVGKKVDDLLTQFISAINSNETEVMAARKTAENGNDPGQIQFCHDIECGTEDPSARIITFDFSNSPSLEANYKYATLMLINNVRNEIRNVLIPGSREPELVDDEIDQIITVAIKVEITNASK
jgi:hypothetical protein